MAEGKTERSGQRELAAVIKSRRRRRDRGEAQIRNEDGGSKLRVIEGDHGGDVCVSPGKMSL